MIQVLKSYGCRLKESRESGVWVKEAKLGLWHRSQTGDHASRVCAERGPETLLL